MWPLLSVIVPAWWGSFELSWALNLLVIYVWVIPSEVKEVLATSSKSWVVESTTVASLRWILAVNHPPGTGLWSFESLFALNAVAGIVVASVWVIKSWSSNIKVSLSSTCRVLIWAEIGGFEDYGGSMALPWDICSSSNFEAGATFCEIPVSTAKSGRDSGSSVVLSAILITTWSGSECI